MGLAPTPAMLSHVDSATPRRSAGRKGGWLALVLVLAGTGAWVAAALQASWPRERQPLWDMAANGWGGVELLEALECGEPLRLIVLLNHQDKWPFGFSLLLLPFLALGGASFASGTWLSTMLFALLPVLLLWAGREVLPGPAGTWGGLLAAGLFLTSPLLRLFGVLVTREMAGAFFTVLACCLYLRAHRLGSLAAWRAAGVAALLLVLVKYNYALLWVATVAADSWLRLASEQRRAIWRAVRERLRPAPDAARWPRLLAGYLLLLVIFQLAGINPGVGIYAGLLVATVVLLWRWRGRRAELAAWWRARLPPVRALLETVVLPLWLWCLSPDPIHPRSILRFLRNRSSGPPLLSAEGVTFYPRHFVAEYVATPELGIAVLALAGLGLLPSRRGGAALRTLALLAALGWLLVMLHPYKEARFLATVVPATLLLAGVTLAGALHLSSRGLHLGWRGLDWRGPGWRRPIGGLARVGVAGLLCAAGLAGTLALLAPRYGLDRRLRRDHVFYSAPPRYAEVLAVLRGRAAGRGRVAVLGTFNEVSDSLLRWRVAQAPGTCDANLVRALSPLRDSAPPAEVRRQLDRWLESERPARILALRPRPGSALAASVDFRRYNSWSSRAIAGIEAHPGWVFVRRKNLRPLALDLLIFDRRPDARPAGT
jgi:hypothetical protein